MGRERKMGMDGEVEEERYEEEGREVEYGSGRDRHE